MDPENLVENGHSSGLDPGASPVEEVRQLREENERLRKENEELRSERDIYHRSLMVWAREKFASEPLPPIPGDGEWIDMRELLDELGREPAER